VERKPALVLTPVARDAAIERLQEHYARNHLVVEDFERRVEQAEDATTTAELERAEAGLPKLEQALVPVETSGRLTKTLKATLGSTTQRGKWRVPSRLVVQATLGSVVLDLVEAEILGDVEIEVRALFGSVEIVVPEGLNVEVSGTALLGSFDHLTQAAASRRDGRRVRIHGSATLGSVEIEVRKRPGLLSAVKGFLNGL
jgi:hypothetical protein